jgi:hypothetical protein
VIVVMFSRSLPRPESQRARTSIPVQGRQVLRQIVQRPPFQAPPGGASFDRARVRSHEIQPVACAAFRRELSVVVGRVAGGPRFRNLKHGG